MILAFFFPKCKTVELQIYTKITYKTVHCHICKLKQSLAIGWTAGSVWHFVQFQQEYSKTIKFTFSQDFFVHLLLNASRSSITQGRDKRFWQLAKKDIPSLAKTSASFKFCNKKNILSITKRDLRRIHKELTKFDFITFRTSG